MSQSSFAAIMLAAGSGTRMKSGMPKVMHPIAGRPMIAYPLEALRPLSPAATLVVIGPRMERVAEFVAPAESVVQDPPLGTGDAVRTAMRALDGRLAPKASIEDVLVLYGDTPFLATETLSRLLTERRRSAAAVLVSGMCPADPSPYGRFVLAPDGALDRIVEAADAGPEEQAIGLVNGGIMVIEACRLSEFLDALDSDNAKREFYLTDVVAIARGKGLACRAVELPTEELLGVNTRAELAEAEALMQRRLRRAAMDSGTTLVAPETVFLSADTALGRDVVVEPNVTFGPGVAIGEGARICSFSYLEGAAVGAGARGGPFSRPRPGAILEEEVHVGNFVEVKAARPGAGAKANHLSYIGDSAVRPRTKIWAGIATLVDGRIECRRAEGKLANLAHRLDHQPVQGVIGIGHTRWATHGLPTETNAHPIATDRVAVVHNGIIENFQALRHELEGLGHVFRTDTDTEAVAILATHFLDQGLSPREAVAKTLARLDGAFALAFLFAGEHDLLIGGRRGSPLAIGYGDGEMFLGSDALALSPPTRRITYLEEGDWAVVTSRAVTIFDTNDLEVARPIRESAASGALIGKG